MRAAQIASLTSLRASFTLECDCPRSCTMSSEPRDVLVRHLNSLEYLLVDASTREVLAGPFDTFPSALIAARRIANGNSVWLEDVDNRGRPLGNPVRIPL